ncbi:eukaryotic translation initiation factor 3 subunit L [Vanessa tameamea]|uniref:Eukaryotic translation initiation factor 3 subunit L n=1 Tax=Vanessa tameamea TaxID=334116 RepID=A0A8B8HPN7_VANTA|nr:eukaryotic translation initiation factor 3 subunit L [Vanessa tameamea]XP_046968457.1 eukaryotic translation initiation factor 3 subunit L [Vanessa cardui]XP_047534630.1 eukaryotic translation initiation factor 3 subunit L [Vanessa atalanta]
MYSSDDYNEGGYESYGDYEPHTGDPQYDLEYDRSYYQMPDMVKKFLVYFRNMITEGMTFEILNLYENTFPKLTEQYFENTPWPDEKEVSPVVDNDHVFMILYKELYFRDIYARVPGGPKPEQRFLSFYNYCDLFNYILSAEKPVPLELPDQWLWELIDEFVYQFQSFAQYRSRTSKLSQAEIEALNTENKAWNVLCILNVLHSLVDKSNIKRQLEVYVTGGDPDSVAGEFGRHSLYKMLGYFSLVGLLRLHSLLGDYYQAIKVLENIELHKKSQYSHVPACQISTSYYVGFAYMMMRRYADAIRTLSSALLYMQRTKQLFSTRSYQNDQINKQTEQMYHLLAICLVLHPQCVDESIQQVLREKNYHEKMFKMQYGDLGEFESCFTFACPKFLSPCPPPIEPGSNYGRDAVKHQTQVFMDEVRQQKMLPTIRSYLKLYTTLPLAKLAAFMSAARGGERDAAREHAALAIHLLCFKHKMKNVVWTKGPSGLDGRFQSGSELDFYIDNDMIHIADTKVAHRYGDFFIRKLLKFEELNRKLHHIKI